MEPSPLTQQVRPEAFQQKVVQLYEDLFKNVDDADKSEGFWRELFLLRPDPSSLRRILVDLTADDLLDLQYRTHSLFSRSIDHIKANNAPSDEIALDTLTVFLGGVLTKKFTNPSSDVIAILAGLDEIDAVFADFVAALDNVIRNGRSLELRKKAIQTTLSVVAGAYQTGLLSYFTHRDLFPSLMKYIQECTVPSNAEEPFTLLGLLVNYNKFEFQNPYRLRLDDFVNEKIIQKIVNCVGEVCASSRDQYVATQDDAPESWGIGSTLTSIGLGVLVPGARAAPQAMSPEAAKAIFMKLPKHSAAILLATYDFANANKLFCFNFATQVARKPSQEPPFSSFLSLTSYLLQHAHRHNRTAFYAYLNIIIIRILLEDQILCKRICEDGSKTTVRLCRQRQPYLPVISGERVLATVILDLMIDCVNHNLRRRLDVDLYIICLGILQRLISHLSRSRTRLLYHWSELWRTLLSFIRFLTSYTNDLRKISGIYTLLDSLINLIALSLSSGDAFLPGPSDYDDLFYKLVETGDTLTTFRDAYELENRQGSSLPTLINVSSHYHELLQNSKEKARNKHMSPKQVSEVIKNGYETLSIKAKEGLDQWDRYREADFKPVLKKIARVAVTDVRNLDH